MTSRRRRTLGALAGMALALVSVKSGAAAIAPVAARQDVDLALVLTVDVSRSIDYAESDLQRKGIADAFVSTDVVRAIQRGTLGRIGVSVVFFSSHAYGVMSVPIGWTVISDQKSAAAFAQAILNAPRESEIGTSISDALELSRLMLESSPLRAPKMVIDVSGDGVNNVGRAMLETRDEILEKGIIINGLPILGQDTAHDLEKYFQSCVIGGAGSFVLPATGFVDFARAIRRKLVLEISGLTPSETEPRLIKAAAAPAPRNGARTPPAPLANRQKYPPYPGGCDFPMFGGFGAGFR